MLSLKQGQKVLDVGCGIGGGAFYMVKVWKIIRMALQIKFPCGAPSGYHFGCHGKKKLGELKLEVAYLGRDVFGSLVPSHSAFISSFMVFLKLW